MALNGMFVEASSVTAEQQWRTDTSAEWRDGPINLGAMRFQPTQIVEVRYRPIPPEVQPWGPDDRSDAALRSGQWEVSPRSDVSGDTPTQIRFVRPGSEHSYSTLSAKDIVGTMPFEAWRTILAALFRPRPLDADHLRAQLRVTTAALKSACHDGWADGDSAMARYLREAGEADGAPEAPPVAPADPPWVCFRSHCTPESGPCNDLTCGRGQR